ncbi:hypothetical protein INT45_013574 [Circinella minor]|uniref:Uncharacterized protein n=1 Tax=Circinella minor TaxID=1195481 RepID=A0A8H7RTN4_9FUNG|nr:hypothetical protein INT45_013574 [Circinella minor]
MNNNNFFPLSLFQLDGNNNREYESVIDDVNIETHERMLDMTYNADFNFVFTNVESHIVVIRTTVAAIELTMAENEEEDNEMLQREEEEEMLIEMIAYESDLLDTIPYERIVASMMEVALRIRIVYEDIFFEIFWGNPVFVKANAPRAHRPSQAYETRHWWVVRHPNLSDNGQGREAFKSHYRITRAAFGRLVNGLMEHPEYAGSQERDGISVEIQVAVVLWRIT